MSAILPEQADQTTTMERSKQMTRLAPALIAASVLVSPVAHAAPNLAGMIVFLDPGHQAAMSDMGRQVPNGRGGTKDCQASGTSTDR